jgi:hypothetical protein
VLGLVLSFGADWPRGPSLVAAAGALWLVAVVIARLRRRSPRSGATSIRGATAPPPSLRVEFQRTGGLNPVPLACALDASRAPREVARELATLVESSGLLDPDRRPPIPPARRIPDAFTYRVALRRGSEERAFEFTDPAIPDPVQPLLRFLTEQAKE